MIKIINRRILILLLLVLAVGIAVMWWVAQSADKGMRAALLTQARIAAQAINIRRIASLSGSKKDLNTPDYMRIKSQLTLIHNARHQCRFLYLMGQRPDGTVFFFADSLPVDSENYAPPGFVYDEVSDSYLHIFNTKQEAAVGPVTNWRGKLISALVPITASQSQKMVSVLGMDIDANDFNKKILYHCLLPFTTMLFSAILILLLAYRDQAAKSRLESEEKQLQTIIEHSNELFYIHDTDYVLMYISPTSEAILGYTPEEIKKKWTELVTDNPINQKGFEITENAIKTGKKQKPYLLELEKKDGKFVLVEIDESPVKDVTGTVVEISGAARDVTLQKQNEDRLIKTKQRFRNLFNSTADLIYTQDMEGRFTSANPAMHRLFGYDLNDYLGHRPTDFMKPELQSGFYSRYLKVIKKQGYHEGVGCYFNQNKEKLYLEHKSSLVKQDGEEPYITGIARDVTEKILSEKKVKKLQNQVAQSQKMESIGTLAGGIAHDFNNILFPILGHTELLMEDIPEDNPFRDSLDEIHTGALRARDLIKQILTFSRQESSELKLMKMQPIIKEALNLIRFTIPATIDIKQNIQAACGVIKADPTQIHQIIMNLVTNAYHAMEDTGGELLVILREVALDEPEITIPDMAPGLYACLTVSDTGIGMDKDLTKKIFDPFFTTKEKDKGTGMGLAVVHGIVNSLGGAIQVYSEPGKGTEFKIYFPIEKSFFTKQNIQIHETIKGGTEKILLVDDEEAILAMEKKMLEHLGYQVTSRTSSIEALEAFLANPDKFDIIITDMAMPNMAGDKLSAELVTIRPDIPVLLCTGFSELMSEEKAISLGIKGFLLKPIIMKDLAHKIREVLGEMKN